MRVKDIPFAIKVNIPLFVLNFAIGVSHLVHRRDWRFSLSSFGAAGFIAGLTIMSYHLHKRTLRIRAQLGEINRRTEMASPAAIITAQENLVRVCKLFGVKYQGGVFDLKVGKQLFRLTKDNIFKVNDGGQEMSGTCYQAAAMPSEEKIASAILLLHNDPTVFSRWARQDGPHV